MTYQVLFFGQTREQLGIDSVVVEDTYETVAALRQALAAQSDCWAFALANETLLVAVNQTMVNAEHPLQVGDEIAFFPPVTGG